MPLFSIGAIDLNKIKVKNNKLNYDLLNTGFDGLGKLIKDGMDSENIIMNLSRREIKYNNNIYLRKKTSENRISPYFIDGLAGLVVSIINRKDLQINDYLKYFKGLSITDGKAPGFYEGLLGIAYANMQLFKKTHKRKYLNIAWLQIRNASQYVEFKNGYSYFRQFNKSKLETNIYNGFNGLLSVYEEFRCISGG